MIWINVGNLVTFAPNIGVQVHRAALDVTPQRLFDAIVTAYAHMEDEHLVEACCGGSGPLANVGSVTYERYLALLKEIKIREAGRAAKIEHTKRRRAEFDSRRSTLLLALIDSGRPYVCAKSGCTEHAGLTVDHIVPLSRGGSDDLSNLQFMCRQHNGEKSDRREA